MRTGSGPVAALVAVVLVVAGNPARSAEPLTIRIAWTGVPGQMEPIIAEKTDLLPHLGKSYIIQHFHFAGSGPMVTALATGDVDIAPLAPSSFGAAVLNAGMDDLQVVTDDYQDGVADYYSSEFLVRPDSPIKTVEDLKGKIVVVNAIGGGSDLALRVMLRRHGLEDRRDYTVVETQFPNMGAMLEARKVDLVCLVAPYSQELKSRGIGRSLFAMRDVFGTTQSLVNVARAGFLDKNRAALDDYFEDYVRALRWFLDPGNRAAAIQLIAQFSKQPAPLFESYLFTKDDYYRDRDGRPNLEALQQNLRQLKEAGFLNADIDLGRHADMSFLDEAVKRLK
jgi:sulfonate transport system substrate-binding protein